MHKTQFRLAGRLNQMVSPNQSAFIKGRFIQDNFMLVQQTACFLHQQKQARILLKLDITKAFGSVSWPFLLEIMKHLGFGPVWCDIISGLLASASTQVLLNGSPGETILHRCGLRQGDPLSPMLFILVMDVLCYMVKKASDEGLLRPLARRALQHRISLYANDVVIFLCPSANDIGITLDILQLFGDASGLRPNVQKSNGFPIQCSEEDKITIQEHLPCQLSDFPCKYLGVPLSLRKLTKQQVQPIIDWIADRLPGWKADLLTKAGRKILVQFVLTSMLVYLAMAMDLPPWALKAIDKIRRGFLWRGRRDAKGGHCLLAWPKVTRPPELGGLGISQLQQLGWALRMRWLWLQKTEPDRPWAAFQIQVHPAVKAFFRVAIVPEVGNGKNTIFWTDRWLHGQSLDQLVPTLFGSVNNKARKRTVYEALTEMKWVQDIRGATTVPVLIEFFKLWDLLSDLTLQPEVDDAHIWQFSSSGVYSAKSAYEGFFIGAVQFGPWERIWKSWAPGKCKFFMWLVAHNRCWTADRLAKRGLPHPECCPFCDQAEETIEHLLISCVFSRQVWYNILHKVGLQDLSPQPDDNSFDAWWARTNSGVDDQTKKDDLAITCKGFCTISWNLKADVQDGCLIFITGDPVTLGCWESNMAVQLAPSVESNNIWTAEIKVPYGVHFKYNYFVREEMGSSSDIIWRPGPVYSLSIPSVGQKKQVIVVKDLWTKTSLAGFPTPSWGSWLMEAGSLEGELFDGGNNQSIVKDHSARDTSNQGLSVGDHIIFKLGNGTPLHAKLLLDNQSSIMHNYVTEIPTASYITQHGRSQVVEEPWILESIVAAKKPVAKVKDKKGQKKFVNYKHTLSGVSKNMHQQDQPVEEPWLFQSILELNETIVHADGKTEARDIIRKLRKIEKPPTPLDESKPTGDEPSSRVILMNSSVCTIQRIAVLEDGKLVELLLEPIKNNVQCDSIYLGVVTKLVPHMGGAFVDIGISRPSLMSIKQNRDPFVYPQVFKNRGTGPVDDSYCNEENLPTYENDDDMSDDEFANEETHDGSSFPVENITDNEEGVVLTSDAKINNVDGDEFDSISVYDEDKDEENDHMEDEYSEDILQGDLSEISNDLKTLSSIQHALRESNDDTNGSRWSQVRKGTKVMVQVVKEGLGTKGPTLSPFPCLRSRFWILVSRGNKVGVSKKITGIERTRLKGITKLLRPPGFTLTARTVAAGHSWEELQKDLDGLLSTWKGITEHAQSAALAAEEGVEGAVPVMLHRAKGQTLSVVQDDFNEKVKRLVVDSPRTYHEVTSYLQEVAPELCNRVELYEKRKPIFDVYNIEKEIDSILCKRVPLCNGGSLVIEQTEALVSVDVNGGHSMFGQGTSQEKAILEVNLEAAKQIARELRLRDIGGIIIVDFIDMSDDSNKRLVYEEMKKAVEKDRSTVGVSELSKLGLMEITRKRVRPSVTFMISEPCTCCHGTGRVEALDTSFSKIEREICRRLAASRRKSDPEKPKSWPRFVLRVDHEMCTYLTSGKKTKLGLLSSSLKVWILLKIARGFSRGAFELLPYSEKENCVEKETSSELPQKEGRPKLSVFPIKKWMSRAKRAK